MSPRLKKLYTAASSLANGRLYRDGAPDSPCYWVVNDMTDDDPAVPAYALRKIPFDLTYCTIPMINSLFNMYSSPEKISSHAFVPVWVAKPFKDYWVVEDEYIKVIEKLIEYLVQIDKNDESTRTNR
jgi:hypothetical protein